MRFGVILAFAVLVLTAISFAGGYEQLKAKVDSLGINYLADDSKQVCAIPVDGLKYCDDKTIYISPAGENKDFFVARLTVFDGDERTRFSADFFKRCLVFNYEKGIIKVQFDPKYYDIDLTYEGWLTTSAADMKKGLQWMVGVADSLAKDLKGMLK